MTTATYPIVSDDPEVQAMYEHCRNGGETHNFAKICAFRSPPGVSTDTTYMAGAGTLLQQCGNDPKEVGRLIKAAKKHGHTPNMHDLYNPTLARSFGHPEGFVPASGPKAHVRKVCEKRGKDCEGLVNYTAPERAEPLPPSPGLSNKLIREEAMKAVAEDPGIPDRKNGLENLRSEIVEKHGFRLGDD